VYVAFGLVDEASNTFKATVIKYSEGNWSYVGSPRFSGGNALDMSIAVDNGIPYVVFSDMSNGFKVTVMKFSDGDWNTVGLPYFSSTDATNSISLVVQNGVPYVAFVDPPTCLGKAIVIKFSGGSWNPVGPPCFSPDQVLEVVLTVDNGTPYVAYNNRVNFKLSVMRYLGDYTLYLPMISR
jgi:hypothetical protein